MVKNVSLSGKKKVDFENKNLHTSSHEEVENLVDCSEADTCGECGFDESCLTLAIPLNLVYHI